MSLIKLLPKILQHQIAAGEVVERPYSVVKELVENSIDAQATRIVIILREGGLTHIEIQDDGSGIAKDDMLLAFERHATSKIENTEDLFNITSYGFRGEALSSISAVSTLTLDSRTDETTHSFVARSVGGEIGNMVTGARSKGTTITVENLFFNTPARLKYLKQAATEYTHIARYITEVALAHPHIRFEVIHNDKKNIMLPKTDLRGRVEQLLRSSFLEGSIPIETDHSSLHISGFISKPTNTYSTRKHQYISVNGRPVRGDLIAKAAREAYHRIIPPGTHPHFTLHCTLPPEDVDVNVHPRKTEVKFARPGEVFSVVKGALSTAFSKHEDSLHPGAVTLSSPKVFSTGNFQPQSRASSPYNMTSVHALGNGLFDATVERTFETSSPAQKKYSSHTSELMPHYAQSPTSQEYTYLGQVHNCYLAVMSPNGLLLIDQHAAHERVLFERLLETKEDITRQPLLQPHLLEITPEEQSILTHQQHTLEEMGFHLEELGDGSIGLLSVPALIATKKIDPITFFMEVLRNFEVSEEGCASNGLHSYREKLLAYTACRSAVKFGDELSRTEAEKLLKDFMHSPRKHTCPHGRCSIVEYALSDLKRLFDR